MNAADMVVRLHAARTSAHVDPEIAGGLEALLPAFTLGPRDTLAIARGLQEALQMRSNAPRLRDAGDSIAACVHNRLADHVEQLIRALRDEPIVANVTRLRPAESER